MGLRELVRLGRGEESSGGRDKPSILADVFEAVLGALYLDGGFPVAREFVMREFADRLLDPDVLRSDPKTRLQEQVQERGDPAPTYETVAERGPDHAREFEVVVRVAGRVLGRGVGRSKRVAEQAAAQRALAELSAL